MLSEGTLQIVRDQKNWQPLSHWFAYALCTCIDYTKYFSLCQGGEDKGRPSHLDNDFSVSGRQITPFSLPASISIFFLGPFLRTSYCCAQKSWTGRGRQSTFRQHVSCQLVRSKRSKTYFPKSKGILQQT